MCFNGNVSMSQHCVQYCNGIEIMMRNINNKIGRNKACFFN